MEYCGKGELFDYIVKNQKLSEEEASLFFYELINGLEHIHSKGVVHRDLKPENLLLTKDKQLKIIDFGLSSLFDGKHYLTTKCGSPSYAAPEIIKSQPYSGFKTDVWCCGIILYAMLCGYLPFEGEENKEIFRNILKANIEYPPWLTSQSKSLIKGLLTQDPKYRIDIPQIKETKLYLKGKELYNIKFGHYKRTKSVINGKKSYMEILKNKDTIKSDSNILSSDISSYNTNKIKPINKVNFNNNLYSISNVNKINNSKIPKSKKITFYENSLTQKLTDLLKTTKRNISQNKDYKKNYASNPKKINYINYVNSTTTSSPTRVNVIEKQNSKKNHHSKILLSEYDNIDNKYGKNIRINNYFNFNIKSKGTDTFSSINSILNSAKLLRLFSSNRNAKQKNSISINNKYRTNSLTTREFKNHQLTSRDHKNIIHTNINCNPNLFNRDFIHVKKNNNSIRKPKFNIPLKSQGNITDRHTNFYAEHRKRLVPTLI